MDDTRRWETEALRDAMARRASPPQPSQRRRDEPADGYVTLREAEAATGIPLNTIRKWARRGTIESRLDDTGGTTLRMVSLDSVRRRADALGRTAAPAPPPAERTEPEAPAGTMLVPVDAWNRLLGQLGNLHEAGRELAEARERAAKAETEARFLRERLAELRAELAEARASATPSPAAPPPEAPPTEPAPGLPEAPPSPPTEPLWRYVMRGFRRRR